MDTSRLILIMAIIIWLILYAIRDSINLKTYGGIFGILRTKFGLKTIEKLGRYKIWQKIGIISIPICVILGFIMLFNIITMSLKLLSGTLPKEAAKPVVFLFGDVIPWIPGVIALLIAISVHELAHGIFARSFGIKVKSSGILLLLGLPLGAFVELGDEFKNAEKKIRGAIASAGPLANLLIFLIAIPLLSFSYTLPTELKIIDVKEPASEFLQKGDIIYEINGKKINSLEDFNEFAKTIEPNKEYEIKVLRDNKLLSYKIVSSNEGRIGVMISPDKNTALLINTIYWTYWSNFLLALFNLLPAIPLDGFHVWNAFPELLKERKNKFIVKIGEILELIINERTLSSITLLVWWILLGSIVYSMW
ncbi:site-2 protease family protein [Methanocaldococcus fervens]|uniref:Peptidase M50 n=1 Tax=Methanocaldococcus fervens (strain DSM 4213 / JCM 15782 / AG86) TaxID=573064 RepID=C7P7Z0_METFA|nr:site-2 protease family protein [Methanocaldococcus fervens]ACV24672.1 peptidase M50 [Methanocaldococcus fervens AG86]